MRDVRRAEGQLTLPGSEAKQRRSAARDGGTAPRATLVLGDVLEMYGAWPAPTVIVSDGAYGVAGFPGDPPTHEGLVDWYRPHLEAWARHAQPSTTLWFWGTEIGWATVHPLLVASGWEYRNCHIWDKGIAHIAGNANTKTLRKFPVVSEVCVQYVRDVRFDVGGERLTMKAWLRHEWERALLPLCLTNEACGVKNAATRKYFTQCHLWYFPPRDAFEQFVAYANTHGRPEGRPYFSLDGKRPLTGAEWARFRAKFRCDVGITNVWNEPAIRGTERFKEECRSIHGNQKPIKLLDRIIRASSEEGDVVWDPFAGLGSVAVAALRARRRYVGAEILPNFHSIACRRMTKECERAAAGSNGSAA